MELLLPVHDPGTHAPLLLDLEGHLQPEGLDKPVQGHYQREERTERQAIFTIRVYIKAWMTVPLAVSAPNNDLLLLKSLLRYEDVNRAISKAIITKLAGHLCYLSEDLIGLVFLDKNVPAVVKRHMVLA